MARVRMILYIVIVSNKLRESPPIGIFRLATPTRERRTIIINTSSRWRTPRLMGLNFRKPSLILHVEWHVRLFQTCGCLRLHDRRSGSGSIIGRRGGRTRRRDGPLPPPPPHPGYIGPFGNKLPRLRLLGRHPSTRDSVLHTIGDGREINNHPGKIHSTGGACKTGGHRTPIPPPSV